VIPADSEVFPNSLEQSTLAAIFPRSQTSFPAEALGEMAGICITDIESDLYYTHPLLGHLSGQCRDEQTRFRE
jgi:hypothetical protein